ncbi:MAG: hypothetical protein IPP19_10940 [Verrucomicrobia bacterium]|nr:hypothetical protein [Verrucomicrobiota bacterium]
MPLQPVTSFSKLSKLTSAVVFFLCCSNWAAAAPTAVGGGSMDDWLALGLAMLAALYCVQKRE